MVRTPFWFEAACMGGGHHPPSSIWSQEHTVTPPSRGCHLRGTPFQKGSLFGGGWLPLLVYGEAWGRFTMLGTACKGCKNPMVVAFDPL